MAVLEAYKIAFKLNTANVRSHSVRTLAQGQLEAAGEYIQETL